MSEYAKNIQTLEDMWKKRIELRDGGGRMSANESEFTREYKCEYYSLKAHPRSCFFCDNCPDIFFDYTNGPYMFMCIKEADTEAGLLGKCNQFI